MLNLFRKHAKSWLIKVALIIIAIVFIFWGGYTYKTREASQVAEVDGHYISILEYNRTYTQLMDMYKQQLGSAFSEDLVRQLNLKQQALDFLVERYLVSKAAGELGLVATPHEIQEKILQFPAFQEDGRFDRNRYIQILRQNRISPEEYEQRVGIELTSRKVEEFVKRRAALTEDEIRADFQFNYGSVQLAYVLMDPKSFADGVKLDDKALDAFYQGHQDRYQDPEKRQFSYVLFSPGAYTGDVNVTPEEIRQSYEDNISKYYHPEEVHALHILFSVKENAPEDEVAKARAEAQKVLQEAKGGKDFKELAKKYSQDPSAAKNDGDLGFFSREKMTPAFSEAAFALKPGEISDLVRTPFGFHIIKSVEVRPEKTDPFDEVKGRIEASLKEEKARDLAYKKARGFADAAYSRKDLRAVGKDEKLQVLGDEAWLAQTDSLPGIEKASEDVMKKLFALNAKDLSDIIEIPQGFLVAQLQAIQAPHTLPFDQVKDRVEKDYRADQAKEMAQKAASELLAAAGKTGSLQLTAKEKGLELKTSEWFSRREPYKDLMLLRGEALNKIFQLEETKPFPGEPLEIGARFLVCQLMGKKTAPDLPEKDRESISKRLLQQKQGMIWQAWISDQRKKAQVKKFRDL